MRTAGSVSRTRLKIGIPSITAPSNRNRAARGAGERVELGVGEGHRPLVGRDDVRALAQAGADVVDRRLAGRDVEHRRLDDDQGTGAARRARRAGGLADHLDGRKRRGERGPVAVWRVERRERPALLDQVERAGEVEAAQRRGPRRGAPSRWRRRAARGRSRARVPRRARRAGGRIAAPRCRNRSRTRSGQNIGSGRRLRAQGSRPRAGSVIYVAPPTAVSRQSSAQRVTPSRFAAPSPIARVLRTARAPGRRSRSSGTRPSRTGRPARAARPSRRAVCVVSRDGVDRPMVPGVDDGAGFGRDEGEQIGAGGEPRGQRREVGVEDAARPLQDPRAGGRRERGGGQPVVDGAGGDARVVVIAPTCSRRTTAARRPSRCGGPAGRRPSTGRS